MALEESVYPRDWLRIAERDLQRVGRCLRDHDSEAAGFFLQQALEKFLKAYLLSNGWSLRRIHDLEALLDDAVDVDPSLEEFRAVCQRITGYYMIERYPLPGVLPPGEDQVRHALGSAQALFDKVRDSVSG